MFEGYLGRRDDRPAEGIEHLVRDGDDLEIRRKVRARARAAHTTERES